MPRAPTRTLSNVVDVVINDRTRVLLRRKVADGVEPWKLTNAVSEGAPQSAVNKAKDWLIARDLNPTENAQPLA